MYLYDPETGAIRSRRTGRLIFNGTNAAGYRVNRLPGGRMVYAHRVAWKLMTGDEPPEMIDHENNNRADNRWRNLRASDPLDNAANQSSHRDAVSAEPGVSFDRTRGLWEAEITRNGQRHRLGRFETERAAAVAYETAARRLNTRKEG